jgi:hypothetical protein
LKSENIEFVSISVGQAKSKDKWEEMVKDRELVGHQLFAHGKAFDSKIANEFMIGSIPRFIIIDPNGKIVDPDAPRPPGKAEERLRALLEEKKKPNAMPLVFALTYCFFRLNCHINFEPGKTPRLIISAWF